MPLTNSQSPSGKFIDLLQNQGIYEALRFLNSQSAHRFTALYAFEGSKLRNICMVDKQDQSIRQMATTEILDSYCFYVHSSGRKFITPDSLTDERVKDHPKQATIQSYCGMPLTSAKAMLGTLCHFDFTPLSYSEEEIALLEKVTPELIQWLQDNLRRENRLADAS